MSRYVTIIPKKMYIFLLSPLIFLYSYDCFVWPEMKTCDPRYHFWQPFYGFIPTNAFLAGVDRDGEHKYIARVISPDARSWSAPTTFSESTHYIFYSWENQTQKVEKFIEILSVPGPSPGFGWRESTKDDLEYLRQNCCMVIGGSGYKDKKKVISHVGRTLQKGKYYVGGVYKPEWHLLTKVHPMRYVDEVGTFHGTSTNFEVLTYDCCSIPYCKRPNKADCCYDIL